MWRQTYYLYASTATQAVIYNKQFVYSIMEIKDNAARIQIIYITNHTVQNIESYKKITKEKN